MCIAAGGPGTAPTINLASTGTSTSSSGTSAAAPSSAATSGTSSSPPARQTTTTTTTTTITSATPATPVSGAGTGTLTSIGFVSTGTSASSGTSTTGSGATGSGSGSTRRPAACKLTMLHAGAVTLAPTRHRASAAMSLGLNLPTGCGAYVLHLQRRIVSAERGSARALGSLKVQLLSRSGQVLSTLATLSGHSGHTGYAGLSLNLAHYAGRSKLTLRFLTTRTGAQGTAFTLRSVALNLS